MRPPRHITLPENPESWRGKVFRGCAVGVNINDTTELQAPFGGWKLSGVGRELGPEGLMAFRESKHIKIRMRQG